MIEKAPSVNVFDEPILTCSTHPLTGFFRDGSCNTCFEDAGSHTVCAIMTAEFLAFSKYVGNDLSTSRPEYGFTGLEPGDAWCLCASRFLQAHQEGCAPTVKITATHKSALDIVPIEILRKHAVDLN